MRKPRAVHVGSILAIASYLVTTANHLKGSTSFNNLRTLPNSHARMAKVEDIHLLHTVLIGTCDHSRDLLHISVNRQDL